MDQIIEEYIKFLPTGDVEDLKNFLDDLITHKGHNIQQHIIKITLLLVHYPYPILQILLFYEDNAKLYIRKIISNAFKSILSTECKRNDYSLEFLSLISNLPMSILEAKSLNEHLIQTLKITTATFSDNRIFLSLLSRDECKTMQNVLIELQRKVENCEINNINKEYILYYGLYKKRHFISHDCVHLKSFHNFSDVIVRTRLLIIAIANEFTNVSKSLDEINNITAWLKELSSEDIPTDLLNIYKYFFMGFQRLSLIIEFLKKHSNNFSKINVGTLLSANSLFELLLMCDDNLSLDDMRSIMESVHHCQSNLTETKPVRNLEIETFNYYAALCIVYDIIIADENTHGNLELYYNKNIQKLTTVMRQIRNIDGLCSLVEDFLQLVFLRYNSFENDDSKESHSSDSISIDNKQQCNQIINEKYKLIGMDDKAFAKVHRNRNFICQGRALYCLFTNLKNYLIKKLHSDDHQQISERLQSRFQNILSTIVSSLTKYALVEKIEKAINDSDLNKQYILLESEELLQLVQKHNILIEKCSSDDENRDRSNYASLARRKAAKKRRRATISGTMVRPTTITTDFSSTTVSGTTITTDKQNVLSKRTDLSIIPKMLCTPENLAMMALSLKNLTAVKDIIETYNIRDKDLNREYNFVEQQQLVKQKLGIIYTNYLEEEQNAKYNINEKPKPTVEQIKNVVAKGFEVSKIISVVDNFSQNQKIQQTVEIKQLLNKYICNNSQYSFLKQFDETNLNAVIITDLILNLKFNYEISSNILMVIKRQQQIMLRNILTNENSDEKESNIILKSSLQSQNIGPMKFIENLCECLRMFEQDKQYKTLRNLLCDNYYSLQPNKLQLELEHEQTFRILFEKMDGDYTHCDDLRKHSKLFQQLNTNINYYERFYAYTMNLAKLMQLRDPNLEYHTNELLKLDICDIIGELIFECDMTPLEIELNVTALNLNLVHVIALNICPEIIGKTTKLQNLNRPTIFNYIDDHNRLLSHLLYGVSNTEEFTHNNNNNNNIMNSVYLQRLIQLPEIIKLSNLYGNKKLVAALCSDCLNLELVQKLNSKHEQLELLKWDIGIYDTKQTHINLIDKIIASLINDDSKNIYLVGDINDVALKAKLIHKNFTKIATTRIAKDLIESTLKHKHAYTKISILLRHELEQILADITVYAKVSEVLQFETWPQAYDFSLKTPNKIFEKLLQLHLYKLCYKWCQVVKLSETFTINKTAFMDSLLNAMLKLQDNHLYETEINKYLLMILEIFPNEDAIEFLDMNKDKFHSIRLLEYIINFLMKNKRDGIEIYRNYLISFKILKLLTYKEREQFWNIISYPLLIIEQLIMNAKFEILNKVLDSVRKSLNHFYKNTLSRNHCEFCYNKQGNMYDVHNTTADLATQKAQFTIQSGATSSNSAFILLTYNLYKKDHIIHNECIDLLLRIYATKALDYHVSYLNSSSEYISQNSIDSLCDTFEMPKCAPKREEWIRDDEVTHCMCCRRAVFSILCRRHHCRRCGRVVCYVCSNHRMRIPELYEAVEVRVCNDCKEETLRKTTDIVNEEDNLDADIEKYETDIFKWKLSGNITHDKLEREEFCYEHAPSVALCLSILDYHINQEKCVELLIYHCRKFEKLIIPNPEVDYELIAKMINCLALAAKVRLLPPEIETIREHSEIVMSVVQNGCETLLPPGPLNNYTLRKLSDSLIQAEKWQLALDIHLKCGFSTAGVMAAHGFSALKAGCFDTAREKFSHCMPKLSNELINSQMSLSILTNFPPTSTNNFDNTEIINNWLKENTIPHIKRPQRGPPLLQEILNTIDSMPFMKPLGETLKRASIMRKSNTSLASVIKRKKENNTLLIHEPAINILTTLDNLKRIRNGQYRNITEERLLSTTSLVSSASCLDVGTIKSTIKCTKSFEEGLHYVLSYGSHSDILEFLMKYDDLTMTLQYFLIQNLSAEHFIRNIYLVCLRNGIVGTLMKKMSIMDSTLIIWQNVLLLTCHYLEKENLLNSLYQLQILLNDPIRASMTCIRFYSMNCENFQQLHANAQHLHNAQQHLESQLELLEWETINLKEISKRKNFINSKPSLNATSTTSVMTPVGTPTASETTASIKNEVSFVMQMDSGTLNSHINTILKQLDVAKFLANCEKVNQIDDQMPNTVKILKQIRLAANHLPLPTLFDNSQNKIHICVLLLYCGKNIEEGYGLAYRIIQSYKLPAIKVFSLTAKYLARNRRLVEVEKLINCINSEKNFSNRDIDELITIAINSTTNCHEQHIKFALDELIKRVHNIELRISNHIFIGQLKSAYLLANKYERIGDIKKILRQAEISNQMHIKKLCERKLNMSLSSTLSELK